MVSRFRVKNVLQYGIDLSSTLTAATASANTAEHFIVKVIK